MKFQDIDCYYQQKEPFWKHFYVTSYNRNEQLNILLHGFSTFIEQCIVFSYASGGKYYFKCKVERKSSVYFWEKL